MILETVPNFSEMEEITCPDCGKPLIAVPIEGETNRFRFEGCRCSKDRYHLPDCFIAGFLGGPMTFYKPKTT